MNNEFYENAVNAIHAYATQSKLDNDEIAKGLDLLIDERNGILEKLPE